MSPEGDTRAEHLAWSKERALADLPRDPANAMASFQSDLSKHPETDTEAIRDLVENLGFPLLLTGNDRAVREFIEGLR